MSEITMNDYTQFLLDVHTGHPGLTEQSIGAARTPRGLSSYEAFCSFVDPKPGMTVVDLACGNGPLCEVLTQRVGEHGQVIGIDLSNAELAQAAKRLHHFSHIRLLNESAQKLSIPDASVDAMLCHMAFMLFTPLKPAVDEIARVLKSEGTFAAVIPTLRKPTVLFTQCASALRNVLTEEQHRLDALSGNAVKMNTVEDLVQIFADGNWKTDTIRTDDIDVSIVASPENLASLIAPAFYHYQLLSPTARTRVEQAWTALFDQHRDPDGSTRFHFPLSAFAVTKR